jgi:hypothetical protein
MLQPRLFNLSHMLSRKGELLLVFSLSKSEKTIENQREAFQIAGRHLQITERHFQIG